MNKVRYFVISVFFLGLVAMSVTTAHAFGKKTPDQARAEILEMGGSTLKDLYTARPASRDLVAKAAGVAAFSCKGMKIGIAGSDRGRGVLVDRSTGKKTFMKMAQVNVGLGYGIQDTRFVFIFQDKKAMEDFAASGWDFSGKAEVGATAQGQGAAAAGAVSFMPGVLVYQFTKNGLAAEITLTGTKFWADKKLNGDASADGEDD
jgi:lipid-binding SYLF domain-containing protein